MITETRIRKVYQPLSLAISVKASGVALSQVVNQFEGTTTPERSEASPTVLTPVVIANTGSNDPSWVDGNYAKSLIGDTIAWYANGVNIAVEGTDVYEKFHNAGKDLYNIVTDATDDTQGSLKLWANLDAEERYLMHMEAKLYDSRTKNYYDIKTDPVELSATALGDDEWDFSIEHDVNIRYNPLLDRLKLYDWLVYKKLIKASDAEKAKYMDDNAYDLTLKMFITKGIGQYTADEHISFEIGEQYMDGDISKYRSIATVGYDGTLTRVNPTLDAWLTAFTKTDIEVDRRKMPNRTMTLSVSMMVKDKNSESGFTQSVEQLSFMPVTPRVTLSMSNNSDIDLGATSRWEKAVVSYMGKRIEYPEAYLRMAWTARASLDTQPTSQGYGEEVSIDQSALDIKVGGKDELYVYLSCALLTGLDFKSNDDTACIKDNYTQSVIDAGSISSNKIKVYKPLLLNTDVEASGMPLIQTDGDSSTQRTSSKPLILTPIILAQDSDASWTDGNANQYLDKDTLTWLVNGKDISTEMSGEYSVDKTETSTRGTLKLWHNCKGGEMHSLQMSGTLVDPRNGYKYQVLTDAIDIMSQTPAEAEWDFSVVHDVNIRYSPVLDRLKLYDWLVAKGETPTKADYIDATGYDLKLPLLISHGHNIVPIDDTITFRLFDHDSGEEMTADTSVFYNGINTDGKLVFDLRFMEEHMVVDVKMYINDTWQSTEQLTFTRWYPKIEVYTTNKSDIDLSATTRWDKAVVMINGSKCEYPEAYLHLAWEAKASDADEWVEQGYGESISIKQSEIPNLTDELLVRLDYRIKSELAPLSNEDGYLIKNVNDQIIVADALREE